MKKSHTDDLTTQTQIRIFSILGILLLLLGSLATISFITSVEAQTAPAKQPTTELSNASSAKNTNATAAITAPAIGNTQQLSKALANTNLLKGNSSSTISQNKTSSTANITNSTS
jgi:hypothetical protein